MILIGAHQISQSLQTSDTLVATCRCMSAAHIDMKLCVCSSCYSLQTELLWDPKFLVFEDGSLSLHRDVPVNVVANISGGGCPCECWKCFEPPYHSDSALREKSTRYGDSVTETRASLLFLSSWIFLRSLRVWVFSSWQAHHQLWRGKLTLQLWYLLGMRLGGNQRWILLSTWFGS